MDKSRFLSSLMTLILTTVLAACGTAATATAALPPVTAPTSAPAVVPEIADPAAIAMDFYKALNAGDIEAAMALVADDVQCRGSCYLNGKQSFQSFMQGSINMGGRAELSDLKVDGEKVSYTWTAYNTDDVPVALGTETLHIKNGLIVLMETQPGVIPAAAESASDPVVIVKQFYELLNARDVAKAMELTDEDYVMNDPFGTYDRAAAATQWQAVVDGGLSFNQTNFVDTGNGRVTSCYEVFENGNSIDKGCGNVTHIRNGKIIFDGLEPAEKLWIVQEYYAALAAKQLDLAMSYAADDLVSTDSSGYYYGKDEITAAIQRGWDAGSTVEANDFKVDGDRVTSCYKYYENGTLLDQSCSNVTRVRDGKIIFDGLATNEALFVVQEYYEALNAKDVDTAMSWVAADALFVNPTGRYAGQVEIRNSLEMLIKDGITFELSKFHMLGNRIIYDYKVMQSGNLLDQGTNGLTVVKDGLVIFDGTEETFVAQ